MANFSTHVGVAMAVGAGASAGLTLLGHIDFTQATHIFIFFVFGTLLPDIDVNNARPVRLVFHLFAAFAAWLAFAAFMPGSSGLLWLSASTPPTWHSFVAAGLAWLIVRYPLAALFQKITRHRGLAHSLIVGCLWALAWLHFAHWQFVEGGLTQEKLIFWLQACALLGGFLLHLLLDELYSIDIEGMRLKRSFGTAMKLLDRRFMSGSIGVMILLGLMTWQLPDPEVFVLWLKQF